MDSARAVLPTALAHAVRLAPLTAEKVEFAWRAASGAALAKVSTAVLRDGGVLVVTSRDRRWAVEIYRLRHELLRQLALWLGPDVVTRIDVPGGE